MTIDDAIADLKERIQAASSGAVIRVKRRSAEEATIRVYAPADHEDAIKTATQEQTLRLLTEDGLDVQVLVYDIATSLPPDQ
ncbi:MAG TPA: hypothetical protein PLO33_13095 [Kouleothrix sp.]|uniref:hypothetical protein n=1 Tax=Kouleothrix sp. TaxID=2779161 RepID=UPI002CAFABBD|nr:hypothetical protein [Kouleothrix sp.]HRC76604.1 hypothetical protein [Kouleothrix sp.]